MRLKESDVAELVFLSMENGKAKWEAKITASLKGDSVEVVLRDTSRVIRVGDRLATLVIAVVPVDSQASLVLAVWEVAKKLEGELREGNMGCLLDTDFHKCMIGAEAND